MSAARSAPRLTGILAVGFDLGETLYHYGEGPMSWLELSRPALEHVTDVLGLDRDRADVEAACTLVADLDDSRGGLDEVNLQDAMGKILRALGADASLQVERAVDAFFDKARDSLAAYPDAAATLAALKERGYKVGALTNVPYGMPRRTIQQDLERVGLAQYLDALVTSADVGVRKPAPQPYQWLAAGLDVELAEMAYVGNSDTDVKGAVCAGVMAVLVDRVREPSDYGQAATVASLSELLALFGPAAALAPD